MRRESSSTGMTRTLATYKTRTLLYEVTRRLMGNGNASWALTGISSAITQLRVLGVAYSSKLDGLWPRGLRYWTLQEEVSGFGNITYLLAAKWKPSRTTISTALVRLASSASFSAWHQKWQDRKSSFKPRRHSSQRLILSCTEIDLKLRPFSRFYSCQPACSSA